MAGIGFELRKLAERETLSSVFSAGGHAAVIAAGPWLFTILSLAAVALTTERLVGLQALAEFRVIIIYAFSASLVLSAPITIVATRLVADALWLKRPSEVRPLLMAALIAAVAVTALGIVALLLVFRPPLEAAATLAAASLIVAKMWVVLAFCGAIRDYNGVTFSFLLGLVVATVGAIAIAIAGGSAIAMVWGFIGGLGVTLLGLLGRVLAAFPSGEPDPSTGFQSLAGGLVRYWALGLGALAASIGVWIDKWLFWFSDAGEVLANGLRHAPLYDSAMFIASLCMIPALAAFVLRLETDFFTRYQRYYATIAGHGTYAEIEAAREAMHSHTLENLALVTVAQVGLSAILILLAPVIIDALGLQFRQVSILRYGALGAVFHFVFISCSAILLFFDRRQTYLRAQLVFLTAVAGMTWTSMDAGDGHYGVGYFAACLLSAFIAYRLADRTLGNLNYLTFIGNNPSVTAASDERRGGLLGRLAEGFARRGKARRG